METAPDILEKESKIIARMRQTLAQATDQPLASAFGELLAEYEALSQRTQRVADLAHSVQHDLDCALNQVLQLSQIDGLTGVMNRPSFEKLFSRDWAQSQREGSPLSLLLINVDNFQAYNALYGPLAGDDCLKSVAQALMRCLFREVDVVARMEGDTFAALLPGTSAEGAGIVGERVVQEVEGLEIPHLESPHGGMVSVSVGAATLRPARGDAPILLVRAAQAALGAAKAQGRGRLVLDGGQEEVPA